MSDILIPWVCGTSPNSSTLFTYFAQPLINLFNLQFNPFGTIIAWLIVIFWFYILYDVSTPNFLNSQNGYIDFWTSFGFAILFYFLTSIIIIFLTRSSLCAAKEVLAKRWAVLSVSPPYYIRDRVTEIREQFGIDIFLVGKDPRTGKPINSEIPFKLT